MAGKPHRNTVPARQGDRVWPSQKAMARSCKVLPSAISQALRRRGHLEFVGNNHSRLGNTNAPSKPVTIGPLVFRSQKRAAEDLGLPRITVRRFMAGTCGERARQGVLAAAMTYLANAEARQRAERLAALDSDGPDDASRGDARVARQNNQARRLG